MLGSSSKEPAPAQRNRLLLKRIGSWMNNPLSVHTCITPQSDNRGSIKKDSIVDQGRGVKIFEGKTTKTNRNGPTGLLRPHVHIKFVEPTQTRTQRDGRTIERPSQTVARGHAAQKVGWTVTISDDAGSRRVLEGPFPNHTHEATACMAMGMDK